MPVKDEAIKKVVILVLKLSDELEKIEGASSNNLWVLHPGREAPEQFFEAKRIIDDIFKLVREQNGKMLSDESILVHLLYQVAATRLQINISDEELFSKATEKTRNLIQYEASRDVDIPLLSLTIDKNPFQFGPITFHKITPEDQKTKWWNWAKSTVGDQADILLLSYARINVPGDQSTSISIAKEVVQEGLTLLRGICFPIKNGDVYQFGILNEYPLWKTLPYRIGNVNESKLINYRSSEVIDTGPFLTSYRLHQDLLSKINPTRLESFLNILNTDGFFPNRVFRKRFFSGFRWLGEATKPNIIEARFALLTFALESFIGGEVNSNYLSTRGITATLSERAAFLIGNDLETRKKVDKQIREFYNMRSGIAHGENVTISSADFEDFGELVREIGWSLIEKCDEFSSQEDFQKWVFDQRYS